MFNRVQRKINRCFTDARLNRAASWLALSGPRWKNVSEKIADAQRILILKPDGIGDVILATGFFRSLRRQCPQAHITIAVRPFAKDLVAHACFADEVMIWNEDWCGVPKPKAAVNLIHSARTKWKANPLDWVLIPRSGWDHANAALYAWWSGASNICAHEYFCADQNLRRHAFVNHLIPTREMIHETEFHRRMLQYLGLDSDIRPQLELPSRVLKKIDEVLCPPGIRLRGIALGIGASHDSKRWPAENFNALAKQLLLKWPDTKSFLIGGREDREIARRVQGDLGDTVFDATGTLSILETAALLSHCALYVGNDSGPIHLAGAVGCTVVEISKHPIDGSACHECSPVRFGPIANSSRVLQPNAQAPECRDGCNQSSAHCIATIKVEQVMTAVAEALGEGRQN